MLGQVFLEPWAQQFFELEFLQGSVSNLFAENHLKLKITGFPGLAQYNYGELQELNRKQLIAHWERSAKVAKAVHR